MKDCAQVKMIFTLEYKKTVFAIQKLVIAPRTQFVESDCNNSVETPIAARHHFRADASIFQPSSAQDYGQITNSSITKPQQVYSSVGSEAASSLGGWPGPPRKVKAGD